MKNKKSFTETVLWRPFTLNISLVLLVFIFGIFIGIFIRNKKLMEQSMLVSARSYFQNIVITRRWNAGYGGVFVEKKKGMVSNPYLENPDIRTVDGKTYTMKNPALMTREISEIAGKSDGFTFHITSLKPLNPGNAADEFETRSLRSFEKGAAEIYTVERDEGRYYYRYMAPLVTEKACLVCHAKQGYREGDIRGGISVRFDITDTEKEMGLYNVIIAGAGIITFGVLFGIIFLLTRKLMKKLTMARVEIEKLAMTDELTGLYNRRYFFTRFAQECDRALRYNKNICVIMMDLDDFKHVNDTYGHMTGDRVLRKIGSLLMANRRASDLVARYGGEEFIELIPETDRQGALRTAEKIRAMAENERIETDDGNEIRCTLSIGVALYSVGELEDACDNEEIIRKADEMLYMAKNAGKNRVMIYP